jgi:hypothetical protein
LKTTIADLETERQRARDETEYMGGRWKKEIDALNQDIANLKEANIQIRQEKDRQLQSVEESYMRRLSERQEKISSLEDQLSSLREMTHKFEGIWRMIFRKERERGKRKRERDNRG